MNTPIVFPRSASDSLESYGARTGNRRARSVAYVVIAIVSFIAGVMVGQLAGPPRGDSRVGWPTPDSVRPHPRSLQP